VLSDSSGARSEGGRLFQVAGPNTANLRWPVDVQTLGKRVYKQTKLSIVVRVIAPLSIRPRGALCTANYCASTIIFLPLQEIWVVPRAWRNVIGHPTAEFMFNITRRLRLTTQYWDGISYDPRTDECGTSSLPLVKDDCTVFSVRFTHVDWTVDSGSPGKHRVVESQPTLEYYIGDKTQSRSSIKNIS